MTSKYRSRGLGGIALPGLQYSVTEYFCPVRKAEKAWRSVLSSARAFSDIGKERGWRPVTRTDFDAQRGPQGALIIGNPEEVVEKIVRHSNALGGISRLTFQMNAASLPHAKIMRAIDLIGKSVAPALRKEIGGNFKG